LNLEPQFGSIIATLIDLVMPLMILCWLKEWQNSYAINNLDKDDFIL
jgi:hypothetical protein